MVTRNKYIYKVIMYTCTNRMNDSQQWLLFKIADLPF